ncbi:helix-turn-helix transcriptional regulator [Nitriliruptoraceae bacterium ZYF776]|nr:helix-turn-helix transcriptional regulator [Profundirhabdus halotolerans]
MGRRRHTETEQRRGQALGQLLTAERTRRHLSQQDAAHQAGLAIGTIRKLESGSTPNPGFYTLAAYAKVLSIDLKQIENLSAVSAET